jgi:hypothetical protein
MTTREEYGIKAAAHGDGSLRPGAAGGAAWTCGFGWQNLDLTIFK